MTMRITYILSGTTLLGGATKSFINLLNQVIDSKQAIPLIITPDKNGIYIKLKQARINVISLPYYFNVYPKHSFRNYLKNFIKRVLNQSSAFKLWLICRRFKPSIIHSNTSVNDIGYIVAKWLSIPHIWHIREYGDRDFNLNIRFISQRLLAYNNYSISITKDIARHRNVYGKNNHVVIYNGIIHKKNNILNLPKERYFLYAGRIEATKGIEDCINAFISFKTETPNDIQLLIAGNPTKDGETTKSLLIEKIEKHGLSSEIQWFGGRDDVETLMSKALATIVPSKFEGFGRVMPEAMSVGCLVIGRNTGGTKEQFDNGLELTGREVGLRFETVAELKTHMTNIIKNGIESYQQMRQDAFNCVNQLYTIENYGKQVLDFYQKILNS